MVAGVEDISTDSMRGPASETTPLKGFMGGGAGGMGGRTIWMLLFVSLILGLVPAIVCLTIYYSNGGPKAECSQPIPTWLYWQGYVSAVNTILPMATIPLILCLSDNARGSIQGILGFFGGPLNLFLFVWFIIGAVWVFSTDADNCDVGMYNGAKMYILVYLTLIPLILLCGCFIFCCLMGASIGMQAAHQNEYRGDV
jgi:hypothetical protein